MGSEGNALIMWSSLAGAILLGALGQVFMKVGMSAAGAVPLDNGFVNLFIYFIRVFLSPWIIAAIASYVIGIVLWLGVLSVADLSLVRPLMSAGYLITLAYGIWSGEDVTMDRVVGTLLIVGGIFFLMKSGI